MILAAAVVVRNIKKCCMIKQGESSFQDLREDIHNLIDGRSFESLEELQLIVDQYNHQKNSAPVEEFHGLSPEQMHRFLYMPFESPELVTFPPVLHVEPKSKAALLLSMLVKEIGEDGIKLTAKGILGEKFCQETSKNYYNQYPESMMLRLSVRTEANFEPLHTIRLTAQIAGLARKYKGHLTLTKKCIQSFNRDRVRELYPLLMHSYIRNFNWGYRDGYSEFGLIQQSFLFTLYLLHKYGISWRPTTFYSDNFLRAFPMILQEIEPKRYEPPDDTLQKVYILRVLQRFADFFSLVDIESVSKDPKNREYRVRATALPNEVVEWKL